MNAKDPDNIRCKIFNRFDVVFCIHCNLVVFRHIFLLCLKFDIIFYIYCSVSRETKSSCLPTNWSINFLLYRKLKHDVIQRRALYRETRQGNTTSEGRHDDLSSLHVTSLDQSYFFIRHINFKRYNKLLCSIHFQEK